MRKLPPLPARGQAIQFPAVRTVRIAICINSQRGFPACCMLTRSTAKACRSRRHPASGYRLKLPDSFVPGRFRPVLKVFVAASK